MLAVSSTEARGSPQKCIKRVYPRVLRIPPLYHPTTTGCSSERQTDMEIAALKVAIAVAEEIVAGNAYKANSSLQIALYQFDHHQSTERRPYFKSHCDDRIPSSKEWHFRTKASHQSASVLSMNYLELTLCF